MLRGLGRRSITGIALAMVGQILALIGLLGALSDSSNDAAPTGPAGEIVSTSLVPASSTLDEAGTDPPTTSLIARTTTSTEAPTLETLDEFIAAFNAANSAGDTAYALDRLHPVVIEVFGAEQCSTWLDERFAGTTIELDGDPTPPALTSIDVPGGQSEVADYFTASALLSFRGSVTETTAAFGYVEGVVHWFTNCEA